jgi:hypothetical protein
MVSTCSGKSKVWRRRLILKRIQQAFPIRLDPSIECRGEICARLDSHENFIAGSDHRRRSAHFSKLRGRFYGPFFPPLESPTPPIDTILKFPDPAPPSARNGLDTVDPNFVLPDKTVLIPDGETSIDTIPNTLDLAEMAEAYLKGITKTLLPESPYFHAPPGSVNMLDTPTAVFPGGAPNWGKSIQAMVMARKMSGYDLDDADGTLTIQLTSTRNMIDPNINRNLINRGEGAWIVVSGARPENQMTTAVEGLIELYKQSPTPDLRQLIQQMITYHTTIATPDHNDNGEPTLHYRVPEPGVTPFVPNSIGTIGYGDPPFIHGKTMRALASWFLLVGDRQALSTTTLMSNFVRNYSNGVFWYVPPGYPEGAGSGHFAGHVHMFANALMGLLWKAESRLKNDPSDPMVNTLVGFVKNSYFFIRNMHNGAAAALGNFGEICATADMLRLAVKLSELGAGDFNEDIERWTRNQIAESQIRGRITIQSHPENPLQDRIGEKVIGLFFEDATHAFAIPDFHNGQGDLNLQLVACGLGNVIHGIFDVWNHIVQFSENVARVNLLLNRATWYLDVKSEIPYRGAVNIVTHSNIGRLDTLEMRIPDGVSHAQVQAFAGQRPIPFSWRGNYVRIANLQPNTNYRITFPQVFTQMVIRQLRSQNQNWVESSYSPDPGNGQDYSFKDGLAENTFVGTFKGNTLVAVDHRPSAGIPLYRGEDRAYWASIGANDAPYTPTHSSRRFRLKPK